MKLKFSKEQMNLNKTFSAGESNKLKIKCLSPLQNWIIKFDGECLFYSPSSHSFEKKENISIKLNCNCLTQLFNFDTDLHPLPLAISLAQQDWSISYFAELKKHHQSHYEQWSNLKGQLQINQNNQTIELNLIGMRDHSFGIRDWNYITRWVLLFGILSDSTFFHVTWVDLPLSHHIKLGYVYYPKHNKYVNIISANDWINFDSNHLPPTNFIFDFKTSDGTQFKGDCKVLLKPQFDINKTTMFFEQPADFTINGLTGVGIAEFSYNSTFRPLNWQPSFSSLQPS
eukprot:TRINITY_DN558_c0_g1_i1.p1 TRINITY_DN558_c0_g1~~TRINITY_DN558_c0_g1_i1.p1  ORF type:complete len:285 (-),score=73.11 TRINITY_DN558_c0_g1_i1:144-998(-)